MKLKIVNDGTKFNDKCWCFILVIDGLKYSKIAHNSWCNRLLIYIR